MCSMQCSMNLGCRSKGLLVLVRRSLEDFPPDAMMLYSRFFYLVVASAHVFSSACVRAAREAAHPATGQLPTSLGNDKYLDTKEVTVDRQLAARRRTIERETAAAVTFHGERCSLFPGWRELRNLRIYVVVRGQIQSLVESLHY